ncbi:exodeoxyribonuclease VII large subunit [Youngiibacter multivorans]|uniref:Exodeoxyribonuclease 7 large subunit n=1 Tax=Youngiibacter multivorans TaxID=937251 RepID=A0ABS4G882_9CLOT|nr:exodeoxyribonuclease VII large subunit [Youngiibacter multivorans]MBP1920772.1 exodeoxyribonuclease VII large subunit [Youngiibacter multivorans]
MKLRTMSVSDLNTYVKRNFDNDFILGNVMVAGEISNFKAHSSGHLYFSLKDENSKINCVMFRGEAGGLKFKPKDGMKAICSGRVSVYVKEGSYQLYAATMQETGLGDLHLEFERIKALLAKEGIFDTSSKRDIPEFPDKVAVITSRTGAAVQDIINVATKRNRKVSLTIFPAQVQGAGSAESLIKAIEAVEKEGSFDVIIIARGGGSFEDLFSFNDENLARAIRKSPVPIVTGIGHEVDFTIADFASDMRAATPSQAAEIVVPSLKEMEKSCEVLRFRLKSSAHSLLELSRERLDARRRALSRNNPATIVANEQLRLSEKKEHLRYLISARLENERDSLVGKSELLMAHSPLGVLGRGYAIVYGENGRILKKVEELDLQNTIRVRLCNGERTLEIER